MYRNSKMETALLCRLNSIILSVGKHKWFLLKVRRNIIWTACSKFYYFHLKKKSKDEKYSDKTKFVKLLNYEQFGKSLDVIPLKLKFLRTLKIKIYARSIRFLKQIRYSELKEKTKFKWNLANMQYKLFCRILTISLYKIKQI